MLLTGAQAGVERSGEKFAMHFGKWGPAQNAKAGACSQVDHSWPTACDRLDQVATIKPTEPRTLSRKRPLHAPDWPTLSNKQRCRIVGRVAGELCERSDQLIEACQSDQRVDPVETITAELIPLASAMKWIEKHGPKTLKPRRAGIAGRPAWLVGVRSLVHRVPLGTVLVLGTWNYPLMLTGVQTAQALAAGNRVLLKPAVGTEEATRLMAECFWAAGVPRSHLSVLDSSTDAAVDAIESGVDLVVLTGAAETGRKVLHAAAPRLSASIMELSGCDAVVVLPGVNLDHLIDCILFGLRFNSSATCIAPRRLISTPEILDQVTDQLVTRLADATAVIVHPAAREDTAALVAQSIEDGAVDLLGHFDADSLRRDGVLRPVILKNVRPDAAIAAADLFAPVISLIKVNSLDESVQVVNECPYRLAASVFGPSDKATQMADRLQVGTVTVNDLIVPTADPRLPFGGRGQSGFGVTRGPEGLLAMTATKVVSTRRGTLAPHLMPRKSTDSEMLHGALHFFHATGIRKRLSGLRRLVFSVKKQ